MVQGVDGKMLTISISTCIRCATWLNLLPIQEVPGVQCKAACGTASAAESMHAHQRRCSVVTALCHYFRNIAAPPSIRNHLAAMALESRDMRTCGIGVLEGAAAEEMEAGDWRQVEAGQGAQPLSNCE